jgi:thiamine transporter
MNERKPLFETKVLTEIIVLAALSGVLYTIRPYTLPFGGSVTLASMVPVMWLSLRRGVYAGLMAGAIFGVLALFIDILFLGAGNIIVTPIQVILEYPIAFGVLGVTGVFRRKSMFFVILGAGVAVFIKFLIHYVVGVFVWYYVYEFPIEYGRYLWPAVYNGSFLAIEFIISAVVLAGLVKTGTLEYGL